MGYEEPIIWKTNSERVFAQVGQELELLKVASSDSVKYAKSCARVWLKNGDTFEVLVRINGTITEVMAKGTVSCGANECQSVYVKSRIEHTSIPPVEPTVEVEPIIKEVVR